MHHVRHDWSAFVVLMICRCHTVPLSANLLGAGCGKQILKSCEYGYFPNDQLGIFEVQKSRWLLICLKDVFFGICFPCQPGVCKMSHAISTYTPTSCQCKVWLQQHCAKFHCPDSNRGPKHSGLQASGLTSLLTSLPQFESRWWVYISPWTLMCDAPPVLKCHGWFPPRGDCLVAWKDGLSSRLPKSTAF